MLIFFPVLKPSLRMEEDILNKRCRNG
uniref:Uncharacterized protein n=1 Tax=Lepeophtheirus salmonis TaxID=72036 RepID=A0A0K2UV36_LEPSM